MMFLKLSFMKSALRAVTAVAVLGGASMGTMACGSEPYVGEVCTFAFNYCPEGFERADGQLLNITNSNAALFTLLGTAFGGDGKTTFALPDLRGRSVVGTGQGPDLSNQVIGKQSGAENVRLTVSQLPSHIHPVGSSMKVDAFTTQQTSGELLPSTTANTIGKIGLSNTAYYKYDSTKAMAVPVTGFTDVAGADLPLSVVNPRLPLNYCIAVQGFFPRWIQN